jgi:hypothetical protein|tara:strand:- start:1252 stop:1629 length:378 start_codon:yes stop_codon:yes gene_type:complete
MANKKVNLSRLAREAGLPPATVFQRVNKLGWSVNKALNTPLGKNAKKKKKPVLQTAFNAAMKEPVVASVAKKEPTTRKPSLVIPDAKVRIEQLEAELLKAKRNCKLAQIAALVVIVAVVMWAVNP